MAASIKTPEQIEKMRVAGRLAAEVLEMIAPHVKPGVTTDELDQICHDYIVGVRRRPANVGYKGFPRRSARRSTTSSATAFRIRARRSRTATSSTSTSP
jgi:methionine aminopeptidase